MSHTSPTPSSPEADFRLGPWTVQPSLQRLVDGELEKPLGPTVLGVLTCLAQKPLQAVCKDELIAGAWLGDAATDEALTTAVYELRKALEDDARSPRYIATIRGRGYRLLIAPRAISTAAISESSTVQAAPAIEEPPSIALALAPSSTERSSTKSKPAQRSAANLEATTDHETSRFELGAEQHKDLRAAPPNRRRHTQQIGGLIAASIAALIALVSSVALSPEPIIPSALKTSPAESIVAKQSAKTLQDSSRFSAKASEWELTSVEFPSLDPGQTLTVSADPETADVRRSIAVMPLESRGEDPLDIARGLSEQVAIDLARSDWLEVVPTFSRAFDASLTSGAVDAIVEGAVRRHGDRVTVTVQLVAVEDGQLLWGGTWERPLGDAASLESSLATEIAHRLRGRLGATAVIARHPEIDEALRLGQHFLDGATPGRARRFFTFAVESVPTLATAHAGLAATYLAEADSLPGSERAAAVDEARRSAATALEIDADLPAAHASVAAIAFLHDGDFERAAEHFARAELSFGAPVSSVRRYAAFLSAAGRHTEAISLLEDALLRAPASVDSRLALARAHYLAKQYDSALIELATLRELAPYDPRPSRLESDVWLVSGDLAAAVKACRRALELAGGPRDVARALDAVFDQTGLEGVVRCLQDASSTSSEGSSPAEPVVDPMQLARFEAVCGDGDSAIRRLLEAKEQGALEWVWLAVDPAFESLRGSAEFDRLRAQLPS